MGSPSKTNRDLRKFGITMACAFAVFGALFLWKEKPVWIYLFGVSGFFLISGLSDKRSASATITETDRMGLDEHGSVHGQDHDAGDSHRLLLRDSHADRVASKAVCQGCNDPKI
jgi:hypothetical protein